MTWLESWMAVEGPPAEPEAEFDAEDHEAQAGDGWCETQGPDFRRTTPSQWSPTVNYRNRGG